MNTLFANIYLALQTVGNKLRGEEQGATAVEYGIMVAGIAVVVVGAVFLLGGSIEGLFTDVKGCVDGATTGVTTAC
ncbi:Flp family type IVb pilin [Paeniglutamicibacter kerguelensis]|uniref:Pilus assembly protein Flp/PilA n=1 Tax=Paeniglutamicibacter kerguelensis TaxID=254788 RepID=A0ABS4X9C7_9MICC|nr:Flp family type IVb pilin [Paeniglutamicibacter kerguelensis]MBP2384848.1 pilus assembly protein Flp/PilA [Paeniglutamicibacter kerguelensis]